MNFSPKFLGLSVGNFRNFRDCFWTVRAEFSGLFLDRRDKIFRTVFGQSRTVLKFGFDPKTDVFRFCGVCLYHSNSMTNCESVTPQIQGSC